MKPMDYRPSTLAKFFSGGSGQEMWNTSSSEGETYSSAAVPIHKAVGSADNLYKLSLQPLSADVFLRQQQTSPTSAVSPSLLPASLAFVPQSTYSSTMNNCNELKHEVLSRAKHKVAKTASLPHRNGNSHTEICCCNSWL